MCLSLSFAVRSAASVNILVRATTHHRRIISASLSAKAKIIAECTVWAAYSVASATAAPTLLISLIAIFTGLRGTDFAQKHVSGRLLTCSSKQRFGTCPSSRPSLDGRSPPKIYGSVTLGPWDLGLMHTLSSSLRLLSLMEGESNSTEDSHCTQAAFHCRICPHRSIILNSFGCIGCAVESMFSSDIIHTVQYSVHSG